MKRVLLVDDMHAIRALMRVYLAEFGFEFVELKSGTEALSSVREQTPDLMVLDNILPGINGLEVLRTLRAEPRYERLPILMLSGDEKLGVDPADRYTRWAKKPIKPDTIKSLVRQMMEQEPS